MSITDPFATLQAMAPQLPDDAEALVLARAACDQARAAEPAEAGARSGRRVRWLVAAAAVGVVSTGALLWPSSGQSAFASWSPTPAAATAAEVDAAQTRCDGVLAGAAAQVAANEQTSGVRVPNATPSAAQLAGRAAVLAEQRGDFTFVLSTNGAWGIGCLAAPGVSEAMTEAIIIDLSLHTAAPAADGFDTLGLGGEGVPDESTSAALAYGRVGANVTSMDVTPVGRPTVHATVAGGYWSAWWPTTADQRMIDAQVVVRLTDGTSVAAGPLAAS
jgi:hypothetical protein